MRTSLLVSCTRRVAWVMGAVMTGDVDKEIAGTEADLLRVDVDAARCFFTINSGEMEVIEADRFKVRTMMADVRVMYLSGSYRSRSSKGKNRKRKPR